MFEKLIVLAVVGLIALLFFGNRLPQVLGDLGKGMKAFKEGLNEGEGDTPKKKATAKPKKIAVKKPVAKATRKKAK